MIFLWRGGSTAPPPCQIHPPGVPAASGAAPRRDRAKRRKTAPEKVHKNII
nr:MAG TPA: hypothetical protein [Caudoviricetes sp.]